MSQKTGAQLIAEERQRQIDVEGYSLKHDLENHTIEDFVCAAMCYATPDIKKYLRWPFEEKYFKPRNIVRDLARAGALIAAALDMFKEQNPEEFEEFQNA